MTFFHEFLFAFVCLCSFVFMHREPVEFCQ